MRRTQRWGALSITLLARHVTQSHTFEVFVIAISRCSFSIILVFLLVRLRIYISNQLIFFRIIKIRLADRSQMSLSVDAYRITRFSVLSFYII